MSGAWAQLQDALERAELVPCRVSAVPDAWWAKAGPLVEIAVDECGVCPVSVECLGYAVAARERDGIWGGLTAEQR